MYGYEDIGVVVLGATHTVQRLRRCCAKGNHSGDGSPMSASSGGVWGMVGTMMRIGIGLCPTLLCMRGPYLASFAK